MKRRIFNILSAGSLVLWLALAVLFVRSFWKSEQFIRSHWDGSSMSNWVVESSGGRIWCWRNQLDEIADPMRVRAICVALDLELDRWQYRCRQIVPDGLREWYKPSYLSNRETSNSGREWSTHMALPDWPFLLLLAILPTQCLRRHRRLRHRRRLGLCLDCGYDLRASEGKCPECGMDVPADVVRKAIT